VLYRGGGGGEVYKALTTQGIVQRGARPTVGNTACTGLRTRPRLGVKPRLLDQVRDVVRRLRCSIRTEQGYVDRIRTFILFHGKRHSDERGRWRARRF
jgi:hypothetical protein